MSFGFNVKIIFNEEAKNIGYSESQNMYNVTEIHYNYGNGVSNKVASNKVAFESDIHTTGMSIELKYVAEFEVLPAKEIHWSAWEE